MLPVAFPRDDPPFPGSLPEFQQLFPDDLACAAYLEAIRWPQGFVCQWCSEASEPYRFKARPHVLRVCALQLVIPATRQRSVAASPAVVLVVEAGLGHRRHFSWLSLALLVVPDTSVAACTLVPFMFY